MNITQRGSPCARRSTGASSTGTREAPQEDEEGEVGERPRLRIPRAKARRYTAMTSATTAATRLPCA